MPENSYQISNKKVLRRRKRPDIRPFRTSDMQLKDTKEALTGKQKAAMLLRSLDSSTAAELLKGVNDEVVHELAEELAHLDAAGFSNKSQDLKLARQFCNSLQLNQDFRINGFLKEMLKSSVGSEKTEQIRSGIQELLDTNDPFKFIYSSKPENVAKILASEHPQTAAVVLSEMPKEKITEVLGFLEWGIRVSIVNRMSSCGSMSTKTKMRIAEVVYNRLNDVSESGTSKPLQERSKPSIRKLAVSLRNMGKEIRNGLLGAIRGRDRKAGDMVTDLMIFWEDLLQISDHSLRKGLKRVDIRKLALALVKSDNQFIRKIQLNITEPKAAVLNEQMLLFSAYDWEDIEQAREEIVDVLREMNEKGELAFIKE